ncbi:hypothetical protein QGN29_01075 [Temperatibacter marinus]|uniref:Glycine zipper family protein n=1 Tax=Temperatibacter marinus TaxID=1456591 RepID=A0AA52EDZ0_9PROT|nr:hypothetical protein [Temperatibacter marinus]WND02955.1 hypothetical protein QGN29_01075 [Temperatibacter marinus]
MTDEKPVSEETPKTEKEEINVKYIGLGLVAGVVFGSLQGNVGLWIAIGISIGAALAVTYKKKSSSED